jgi:precorrin-6A/cobalt-precorrin-6A reductase
MILVMGGTSDARLIAGELGQRGAAVLVSTATGYGARLAAGDRVEVIQGRLGSEQMRGLIQARGIRVLVDASHPYAEVVSINAEAACKEAGIHYIRYVRPELDIPQSPLVEVVDGYAAAAARACDLGKTILVATGVKTAAIFAGEAAQRGKRVVFRVMPDPASIKALIDQGISPGDMVALQGPFSEEMNTALIRHFGADVLVTKESGAAGGFMEKVRAAEKTGVPLIVVGRPRESSGAVRTVEEAVKTAVKYLND